MKRKKVTFLDEAFIDWDQKPSYPSVNIFRKSTLFNWNVTTLICWSNIFCDFVVLCCCCTGTTHWALWLCSGPTVWLLFSYWSSLHAIFYLAIRTLKTLSQEPDNPYYRVSILHALFESRLCAQMGIDTDCVNNHF